MRIPSATQVMIPEQVSNKRLEQQPPVIERAQEKQDKPGQNKNANLQIPEVNPDQVEAVLIQANELIPSNQQRGSNASGSAAAQQAINAYESQTEDSRRDYVRSVVEGIDVFV